MILNTSSADGLMRALIKSILRQNYSSKEFDDCNEYISLIQAEVAEIATAIDDVIDRIIMEELVELALEVYEE